MLSDKIINLEWVLNVATDGNQKLLQTEVLRSIRYDNSGEIIVKIYCKSAKGAKYYHGLELKSMGRCLRLNIGRINSLTD